MNLIEQAAQRLAELSRAGVPTPFVGGAAPAPHPEASQTESVVPIAPAQARLREAAGKVPELAPVRIAPRPVPATEPRESPQVELDLERLLRGGYLVPGQSPSRQADEFRHLKRVLTRNIDSVRAPEDGPSTTMIMVTSSLAGEGKTYCSINLAISFAQEIDRSVLLIDADVVRPSVLRRLGLPPRRGLLDALADPSLDPAELIVRTNLPKLSLLSAGTPSPRADELLASLAMEKLLEDLSGRYPDCVILFDAPPLLMTTGASTLAHRMGQIVMIVEAAQTSRHSVLQAFAALEDCPIVLSVLNKCSRRTAARNYGYYAGPPLRPDESD